MSVQWSLASIVSDDSDCRSTVSTSMQLGVDLAQPVAAGFSPPDQAEASSSNATPTFSDRSRSSSSESGAEHIVHEPFFTPVSSRSSSPSIHSSAKSQQHQGEQAHSEQQCDRADAHSSTTQMIDLTEPAGGVLAGGYAASVGGDTSEDEMLQVVAQSARRIRRPLLLESESDTDSLPQTSSPDVHSLSNVVAFALPGRAASTPAQPGVSGTRTNQSKLKQLSKAAVVMISDSSDDAAPTPARDIFELSPSSRSTSSDEHSDNENENQASSHVTAQLAGLQIRPQQTPTRPVQTAKLWSSVPPKVSGGLYRPSIMPMPNFKKKRESLAYEMFHELNAAVFSKRLPGDLKISWNAHLNTTAGLTYHTKVSSLGEAPRYTARVELSTKVLDNPSKLQRTLCHELCHVATWLLDHVAKPPHGPHFKAWAAAAMDVHPHLDVTTCHSYDIHFAWRWQCSNPRCLQMFRRHSNSIDISKQVCSGCRYPLHPLGKFNADGTPAKTRQPSQYSLFVKDNFAAHKRELGPGTPHKDIMQSLSASWKARPVADAASQLRTDHARTALTFD